MRVSVLIATKDRPDRLRVAVQAVLAQEGDFDLELIVKDGSASASALSIPYDDRLTVVHGPDASIPHAFNEAAEWASGDIMHNANDDDLMLPGTIQSAVEALTDPAMAGFPFPDPPMWTYAWMRYRQQQPDGSFVDVPSDEFPWRWQPDEMMKQNCVHQPTVFYTRAAWLACGPFNEDFRYAYDYEFWGRLGARSSPVVRDHCDAVYTFWPGSTSVATPWEVEADADAISAMWREVGFGNRR